jgi:hypothetical protein
MKKIQDQLSALVSAPPSRTPAAPPLPEAAPQIPSATLRSRPSLKVVVRIDRAAGEEGEDREQRHSGHEDAPAAEQVSHAAA